mgnify:CR=1 FL=1
MITLTATIQINDVESITLDYTNLKSLETNFVDRNDIKFPSWGVISNSGKASFIDKDESIRTLSKNLNLKSGMKVVLALKNTSTNSSQNVATLFTTNWDYNVDNKEVSVSFSDNLERLQDIQYNGITYDYLNVVPQNFEWLYKHLYDATIPFVTIKEFEELDDETKEHLSNLFMEYPFINPSNLWSAWNKFANATQTHIYVGMDGVVTCQYLGGN